MEPTESEPFCIFRELFRKYDAEAKLILLEEIMVVGEAKELWFLETLADDEDPRVRKRAAVLARELSGKLRREALPPVWQDAGAEVTGAPGERVESGETPMFDVEFDFQEYLEDTANPSTGSGAAPSEPVGSEDNRSPLMEKLLVKINREQA